jgi:hypothetical protein
LFKSHSKVIPEPSQFIQKSFKSCSKVIQQLFKSHSKIIPESSHFLQKSFKSCQKVIQQLFQSHSKIISESSHFIQRYDCASFQLLLRWSLFLGVVLCDCHMFPKWLAASFQPGCGVRRLPHVSQAYRKTKNKKKRDSLRVGAHR